MRRLSLGVYDSKGDIFSLFDNGETGDPNNTTISTPARCPP